MAKVEKRPGSDWDVHYMDIDDGNRDVMTVFGAADMQEALNDAMQSLTWAPPGSRAEEVEVLAIVRRNIGLKVIQE